MNKPSTHPIKPIPADAFGKIAAGAAAQVTDSELNEFAHLIYSRTGIRVSPQKKTLLSNRLRRRLRETGITTFSQYYQHLRKVKDGDPEWDAFLQEITTHETYLFRDESQWDWFRKTFLPEFAARPKPKTGKPNLRIWSAACSTGDEPITIASCVAGTIPNLTQWSVEIVGTDIGIGALEQARSAVFGERSMRLAPEDYRRRFFTKAAHANIWQAKPILTGMIHYKQHNLLHPLRERPFDLVILKNVLIYFDGPSKQTVMNNICSAIKPGGLLLAGAAEGILDYVKGFKRIMPWLYLKPNE